MNRGGRPPWLGPVVTIVLFGVIGILRAWPAAQVIPGGVPDNAYPLWSFWHLAYSDIVALYKTRDIYLHRWPYLVVPLEYPPVVGIFLWLASWAPKVGGFLMVNAVVLTGAAIGALVLAARIVGWERARLWAFSPLLAIYMIYNWDVLGILFYGLAAYQYHRGRDAWSGWWLGLGIATKLFPVVLLPFMLVARWRAGDRAGAGRLLGATLAAFLITNVPFAVANVSGWAVFWTFNASRGPSPGFWQWLIGHHLLTIRLVDGLSLVLVGAFLVVLTVLVWRRRLDPLLAAATLLTFWLWMNKVYSPQYVVWVLYALVVADGVNGTAWLLAVAGYLDFILAMLWLATGFSHLPQSALIGAYLAPVVLAVRYLAFATVLWRQRLPARIHGVTVRG